MLVHMRGLETKPRKVVALAIAASVAIPVGSALFRGHNERQGLRGPAVTAASTWANADELAEMGLHREMFDRNVIFVCHSEKGESKHHYTLALRREGDGLVARITDAENMSTWRHATGTSGRMTVRELEGENKKLGEFDLAKTDTLEGGEPGSSYEVHLGKMLRPGRGYSFSLAINVGDVKSGGLRFVTLYADEIPAYL